jgi:salicylate hydroxylase
LSLHAIICGAGIGGLTAALTLARGGCAVTVVERVARLEPVGAGLQMSPNAARILLELGLGPSLADKVVAPRGLKVMSGQTGTELMDVPLGAAVEARHGAPYWVVHRGDLQLALAEAVSREPGITLRMQAPVADVAVEPGGVRVAVDGAAPGVIEGDILIGADGLWSTVRQRLVDAQAAAFRRHTAWRALVPSEAVPAAFREPLTFLWLAPDLHLVHYPVCGGRQINVVAIVADGWRSVEWSTEGDRDELLGHFTSFPNAARGVLEAPRHWLKWALFDRQPLTSWGEGRVTLLGDAAHPMVPFLAQGAAMAIEDAAVLARCVTDAPGQPDAALRRYETIRRPRTNRVQKEARETGSRYHMTGPMAVARDMALRLIGGERFLARYDWLYGWQAP